MQQNSHFGTQCRTVLSGSEKRPVAHHRTSANPHDELTVSVVVRRMKPFDAEHISGRKRLTRSKFEADHGADPAAVTLVQRFAWEFGLEVEADTPAPGRRTPSRTRP